MKNFILFIFSVMFGLVYCQNKTQDEDDFLNSLERKSYDDLFNSEFAKLASGQSLGNFGQYASISTTNDIFKGSIYLTRNLNFSKVTFSGGTKDGIGSLFTKDKFNSNISLGYDYFLLIGKPIYHRDESQLRYSRREEQLNFLPYQKLTQQLSEGNKKLDSLQNRLDIIDDEVESSSLSEVDRAELNKKRKGLDKHIKLQEGLNTDTNILIEENRLNGLKIIEKSQSTSLFIER